MKKQLKNQSPIIKIINNSLVDLPSPINISSWWNFGSLLGICLVIQLLTGIFLSIHYTPEINSAFERIIHICRDVNYGWIIRVTHANGASIFFIFIYLHIGRGIYYGSYTLKETWITGVTILLLTIITAFLGYVLPWGQISFWGATVITNLLSAIPIIGPIIVQWIWGRFTIENATLTRFFAIHFILPFIITALIIIHLLFLHQTGSNNPLGTNRNINKIPFHPYFSTKDLIGFIITLILFSILITLKPYIFNDPENFIPANPLITPEHIQPEWYFLFAYAILRSIPNKLGGVTALFISIIILYILPFTYKKKFKRNQFYPINKILFWIITTTFLILTWIGARPIEDPFFTIGQVLTITYFSLFIINSPIYNLWDKLILK